MSSFAAFYSARRCAQPASGDTQAPQPVLPEPAPAQALSPDDLAVQKEFRDRLNGKVS